MMPRWRVVIESDATLMIEFDQDHWTMDSVIENTVLVGAAHPPEERLREMALDLVALHLEVAAEGRGEDLARKLGPDERPLALLGRERPHQRQPLPLLGLEDARAGLWALVRRDGLGAHEHRGHHDLIAEDEAVDDEVVSVDLPAPRPVERRDAHHAEPVEPLAVLGLAARDRQDEVVEPHDVARRLESVRAQALPPHGERPLALRRAQLVERDAVAHEKGMDVAPSPPRVALQRKERALSLRLTQRIHERAAGVGDASGGDARLLDREETRGHAATGGDALEGLGDQRFAGLDVFLERRRQLRLTRARGDRRALPDVEAGRRTRHRARS